MGAALSAGCSGSGDAGTTVITVDGTVSDTAGGTTGGATDEGSSTGAFETLPPVDSYLYPTEPDAVVVQISSRVSAGPTVPLLTVYGDGLVIAGTAAGWFEGRIADGDIQLLLDEAESVGLLDDELVLRGPDTGAEADLTVLFDVDGTTRVHEFDLSRIERPVALRAFLQDSSVYNRFALSDPFDPGAWLHCKDGSPDTSDGTIDSTATDRCEVLTAPSLPTDRPVLPHEDADTLTATP